MKSLSDALLELYLVIHGVSRDYNTIDYHRSSLIFSAICSSYDAVLVHKMRTDSRRISNTTVYAPLHRCLRYVISFTR